MGSAFLDANDEPEPGAQKRGRRRQRVGKNRPGSRAAALLQTAGALVFIPQAALIALSVGRIASGGGLAAVLWPALFIVILGIAKSCLEAAGGRLAFKAARAELSKRRAAAVAALARRSPVDPARPASGEAASVIGEQAELIVPYIARFQPARSKATAVPLAILVCIFPISWIAALILLIAMPLIPLFMALIGWRAQAASEKQLAATGGLNGFLLDRLRGLTTIRALGAVDQTASRLRADADDLKTRTMAVLRIAFLSSAVLELFAALGVALLAVYVGFSLLGEITIGAWTGGLDLTTGLFLLLLAPAFSSPCAISRRCGTTAPAAKPRSRRWRQLQPAGSISFPKPPANKPRVSISNLPIPASAMAPAGHRPSKRSAVASCRASMSPCSAPAAAGNRPCLR